MSSNEGQLNNVWYICFMMDYAAVCLFMVHSWGSHGKRVVCLGGLPFPPPVKKKRVKSWLKTQY